MSITFNWIVFYIQALWSSSLASFLARWNKPSELDTCPDPPQNSPGVSFSVCLAESDPLQLHSSSALDERLHPEFELRTFLLPFDRIFNQDSCVFIYKLICFYFTQYIYKVDILKIEFYTSVIFSIVYKIPLFMFLPISIMIQTFFINPNNYSLYFYISSYHLYV